MYYVLFTIFHGKPDILPKCLPGLFILYKILRTIFPSNFVVGLEGEIVQCVPTWEVAYASNSRNIDTVSIECCHPDETGEFNDETYRSMVQLCAWLCLKFGLDEEDVIRHHDVTGKNC